MVTSSCSRSRSLSFQSSHFHFFSCCVSLQVSYVRLTFVTIIMVSLNLLTSNDHYSKIHSYSHLFLSCSLMDLKFTESSGVKTQNMLNTMSQICSGTNSNMVVKFVFNMPYFYSILPFEGCTNSIHRCKLTHNSIKSGNGDALKY